MANNYQILSEDAIKYLCGLIRDLASVSEGIDNINLADDKTFSNIYIKNLIDKCLEDANAEAEKLVGALTHLTCEETAIQPTLDNSEINVIYLYSADGNPPYQQFLKISEDKLVDLGSTSISLEDYIKAADVAKDYATKVELKAVTDKIGTTTLTTTDTTITGAIEEVKGNIEELSSALDELENITKLTDFDEAIPEKGKNKIYYVNKVLGTYKCAQWRVESMYYDVSGAKQYRGVQKATSINGVDNIILMREYYLDNNVMRWSAWKELATMDKIESKYEEATLNTPVDWNTLNTKARYYVSGGEIMTNAPMQQPFGELVVETAGNGSVCRVQKFFSFDGRLYMRRWTGSIWNEWYRFDGTAI